MWHEIARLAREDGLTVVLTTHYMEEADCLAQRVAIIDRGQIVVDGTPEGLKAELLALTLVCAWLSTRAFRAYQRSV